MPRNPTVSRSPFCRNIPIPPEAMDSRKPGTSHWLLIVSRFIFILLLILNLFECLLGIRQLYPSLLPPFSHRNVVLLPLGLGNRLLYYLKIRLINYLRFGLTLILKH